MKHFLDSTKGRVSLLSLSVGMALAVPNMAQAALDSRCVKNATDVVECLGNNQTSSGATGTPQSAFHFGLEAGSGVIIKDFDYIVPEHAKDVAQGWGGAWTMGIGTYGHKAAYAEWSPEYKTSGLEFQRNMRGNYYKNVNIEGSASVGLVGIFHFNNISHTGHRDQMNLEDVNVNVTNTRTQAWDASNQYDIIKFSVMGVAHQNEGANKNSVTYIEGNSTIQASRLCKIGQACDTWWEFYGVHNFAQHGHSNLYLGENVTVSTQGDRVHGVGVISRSTTGYGAEVENRGTIKTDGELAHGILVGSDNVEVAYGNVTNSGYVETMGKNSNGIAVNRIQKSTINNDGYVGAYGEDSKAIAVLHRWGSDSILHETTLNLGANSSLYGGWGNDAAGIHLNYFDGMHTINNAGDIRADNFRAIQANDNGNKTSSLVLNNEGVIAGYQHLLATNVLVNNNAGGTFELEYFDPQTGGKSTVESRFSNNNTGLFNNAGLITLSSNMTDSDPSNAVFTGINSFHLASSGVIDLTTKNAPNKSTGFGTNNRVGDSFTVTNDTGTAIFYSNGGLVMLNTDLSKANAATVEGRLTDRLIVDKAMKISAAAAPTYLKIVPTKLSQTQAKDTAGEGIQVVKVNHSSTRDAFALAAPVVAGTKQYVLYQPGSTDWYLTSDLTKASSASVAAASSAGTQLYNPSVGAYLANQASMIEMTSLSLADRTGQQQDSTTSKSSYSNSLQYNAVSGAVRPAMWMQQVNGKSNSAMTGSLEMQSNSQLLRMGGDISSMKALKGDLHLGWVGSMGSGSNSAVNNYTGTGAKGTQEGHAAGMFGTWYQNEQSGKGLYVDGWTQFGSFSNTIKGAAQVNGEERYRSSIFSASLETGYTLPLGAESNGWTLTPQAQLTHHQLRTEGHEDANMLTVHGGNVSGVVARVGARLDAPKAGVKLGTASFRPYMEANWIADGVNNQMRFNDETLSSSKAKQVVETKLGFQGEVNKNLKVWTHASSRFGENSPNVDKYGMYTGVTYRW